MEPGEVEPQGLFFTLWNYSLEQKTTIFWFFLNHEYSILSVTLSVSLKTLVKVI